MITDFKNPENHQISSTKGEHSITWQSTDASANVLRGVYSLPTDGWALTNHKYGIKWTMISTNWKWGAALGIAFRHTYSYKAMELQFETIPSFKYIFPLQASRRTSLRPYRYRVRNHRIAGSATEPLCYARTRTPNVSHLNTTGMKCNIELK